MIRQAMILAAGEGRRMRPLTLTTPKPLLEVGGKPLIVWHIEKLINAGVERIVINARYLSEKLIEYFAMHDFGVDIYLSLENEFDTPIETAGGIKVALDRGLLKDEPFILINGDVWTDLDFACLADVVLGERLGHLYLVDNPSHNPKGDFGLLDNGMIDGLGEPLTFAGLSVLSPNLVADTPIGTKAPLAPVLREAILQGRLSGEKLLGGWVDVGTPERLGELNASLKITP